MSITVHRLGTVEYEDGLVLQRRFQDARKEGLAPDSLMLLEHPAVLTLGRGAKAYNVLASPERLAQLGVTVHETDRGGDVTYHGPGQIVGYPLLYLPPGQQDVRKYVRRIEEVMIRTVAHFGITAGREEKWPGVWTKGKKIAALGVHLSRWYTRHGFALNVNPNLEHFSLIVPCGIKEAGVTSMAEELGTAITVDEVLPVVARKFGEVFEQPMVEAQSPISTVSVAVRRGDEVLTLQRTDDRGGFWQIVTGRVEAGESPQQAALREVREETGAPFDRVASLDYVHALSIDGPQLIREHAFTATWPTGATLTLSEHQASEWLPKAQAIERMPFVGLKEAVRRS